MFIKNLLGRVVAITLVTAFACAAAPVSTPPLTPDIPKTFEAPTASADYVKREMTITMRDGVRRHAVIIVPKNVRHAPIIFTPYNASKRAERNISPSMLATLPMGDEVFVSDGYIRVFRIFAASTIRKAIT